MTTLSNLEILTRSQIQLLHGTKSVRNTNYIMKSLRPYTNFIRLNEYAYYLNKHGREIVGSDRKFRADGQLTHKIMRNDAYIYFKPTRWITEQEITIKDISVRPDAYFYAGDSYYFLEVDNLQRWSHNVKKLEEYKKLKDTGIFQRKIGVFPTIVWVIKLESRKPKLIGLSEELGLQAEVYYHDEVKI